MQHVEESGESPLVMLTMMKGNNENMLRKVVMPVMMKATVKTLLRKVVMSVIPCHPPIVSCARLALVKQREVGKSHVHLVYNHQYHKK